MRNPQFYASDKMPIARMHHIVWVYALPFGYTRLAFEQITSKRHWDCHLQSFCVASHDVTHPAFVWADSRQTKPGENYNFSERHARFIQVRLVLLIYSHRNKLVAILQTNFRKLILWDEIYCILIETSPKTVPTGSINNKSALVQIMNWYQIRKLTSRLWVSSHRMYRRIPSY